jgi:antitoxin ParD1/3/4
MPTRNVVLTAHQSDLVEALVRSGRYQNASEVLREGLRLIERQEAIEAAKLKALRAAVDVGWRDLEAGRYREVAEEDLDSYLDELEARAEHRS